MKQLNCADLFCGAGGTSSGAESTGAARVRFAVNHWSVAVQTHSANFPDAKHVNSRLDQVSPNRSYVFCGTKSDITRQIGNSVSPPVAAAITRAIAGPSDGAA